MKTLLSLLLLLFFSQVQAAIRVIPCKAVDCNNTFEARRASITVVSRLVQGSHQIYFYNVETKQSFYFTVSKFYEPEMRRMFTKARGPYASAQSMGKYIKDVYESEEAGVWPIVDIPQPNEGSVMLGEGRFYGVWFMAFPILAGSGNEVSGMIRLGNSPFGTSPWLSGMNSAIFSYLVETSNLNAEGVINALNSAMGTISQGNTTGQDVGFKARTGFDAALFEGSVEGSYLNSDGTTRTFQFNALSPSVSVLYPDGMIVFKWNGGRNFDISHVVDKEGNVINFVDGKLAVDTSQFYTVSPVNAELWMAILNYMGIVTERDKELFRKIRFLKEGIVIICGGSGFPTCPKN